MFYYFIWKCCFNTYAAFFISIGNQLACYHISCYFRSGCLGQETNETLKGSGKQGFDSRQINLLPSFCLHRGKILVLLHDDSHSLKKEKTNVGSPFNLIARYSFPEPSTSDPPSATAKRPPPPGIPVAPEGSAHPCPPQEGGGGGDRKLWASEALTQSAQSNENHWKLHLKQPKRMSAVRSSHWMKQSLIVKV